MLPKNRISDFTFKANDENNNLQITSAAIEVEKMSENELSYYSSLSDEELERKLKKVQQIVSTANPGTFEDGCEEVLNKIATHNGLSSFFTARKQLDLNIADSDNFFPKLSLLLIPIPTIILR